jgi:hypothetical protein
LHNVTGTVTLLVFALAASSAVWASDKERKQIQADMDAQCESARQAILKPEKAGYVAECIATQKRQTDVEEYCERFYANYGERAGRRAPLYYDLPECVEALDYQKSTRSR